MKLSLVVLLATISLNAETLTVNNDVVKYNELKNDLYVKKTNDKRNLIAQDRDSQEVIRNYKALKLYASIRR